MVVVDRVEAERALLGDRAVRAERALETVGIIAIDRAIAVIVEAVVAGFDNRDNAAVRTIGSRIATTIWIDAGIRGASSICRAVEGVSRACAARAIGTRIRSATANSFSAGRRGGAAGGKKEEQKGSGERLGGHGASGERCEQRVRGSIVRYDTPLHHFVSPVSVHFVHRLRALDGAARQRASQRNP